jgi:hypothetical protein
MTTEKINEEWLAQARTEIHEAYDLATYHCMPTSHTTRCNTEAMRVYRRIETECAARDPYREELLGSMPFYETHHSVLDAIEAVLGDYHAKRPKDLTERESKLLAAVEVPAAYGHGPGNRDAEAIPQGRGIDAEAPSLQARKMFPHETYCRRCVGKLVR